MTYRRFRGVAALATVATDTGTERPGRNATPATVATSATVRTKTPEVSQLSQVSHGVSNLGGPSEPQTVANVAKLDVNAEDWLATFDERAGHLEYSEHLPRAEAERIALSEMGERPFASVSGLDFNSLPRPSRTRH